MSRKPTFFTSDLHIGHSNVMEYSNRPFRDLEHMHQALINNYNACVPDDGICYFLGDMGLCSSNTLSDFISKLNGTKVLILGNHDKKMNAMYKAGFDVVLYAGRLRICGEDVTMSHCPLMGVYRENVEGMKGSVAGENWHGESRESRKQYSYENYGQFHLSGHTHKTPKERTLGRQMDVGIDGNGYRPVSISKIESWIVKTLRDEKYNKGDSCD